MTVTTKVIFLLLLSVSCLYSCGIWSKSVFCELDYETNTIRGFATGQKEFYTPSKYIPCLVEELLGNPKCGKTQINENWRKYTSIKYARYHIYGCQDTSWAKKAMVSHIIDKYNIVREDTTYLDTVLLLTVVDESKLDRDDDCKMQSMGTLRYPDREPYTQCLCYDWYGPFFLPFEYKYRSYSVEFEPREGKYNYVTPLDYVEEHGLEAYSDKLLEKYGVTLTFERVDTITLPVYKYSKPN